MNYNFNMSKIYMNKLEAKIKELEERIDKAIEYIEDKMDLNKECPQELIDILKGSDNNV